MRLRLGNHLLVAGPRRTGKSSVAGAVAHRLAQDGVIVVSTEFMYTTTLAAFCRAMFEACAEAAAGAGHWWDQLIEAGRSMGLASTLRVKLGPLFDIGVGLSAHTDAERRLEQALALPEHLAERLKRPVVVVMDEFQDAGKLHADFYRVLRRYVVGGGPVAYLFLGSRASLLRDLFVKHNEPLYRTAFEVELPDAPWSDWMAYLHRKFAEAQIEPDRGALAALLERTGGHPQDTMMLAAEAYASLCRQDQRVLRMEGVAEAGDRVLKALELAFQAEWQDLSRDRGARIALPRIAKGESIHQGLSNAESKAASVALQRLVREGTVGRASRGRYTLREPLFGEWLRLTVT